MFCYSFTKLDSTVDGILFLYLNKFFSAYFVHFRGGLSGMVIAMKSETQVQILDEAVSIHSLNSGWDC